MGSPLPPAPTYRPSPTHRASPGGAAGGGGGGGGGTQSPLLHPGSTHALFCRLHDQPHVLLWTDRLRAWLSAEVVRPLAALLDTSADTTNAAVARFCSTVNTAPFITVTPLRVGSRPQTPRGRSGAAAIPRTWNLTALGWIHQSCALGLSIDQ
jgi:hypothetical protein